MENKVYYRNFLIKEVVLAVVLIAVTAILNIAAYRIYTRNFNNSLDAIVTNVTEKYPEISDNELIDILNSEKISGNGILAKYGINTNSTSVIRENIRVETGFVLASILVSATFTFALILIFSRYNKRQEAKIQEIIGLVENINRKNYSMKIDDISEDELSILKNEIYKTMINLKESAENSLKDKMNLKKALEDISHQIKTPLTSIMIMLDNMIDDPEMPKETREDFIREIKREVNNISFLVYSILKLSEFDTNTTVYVREEKPIKDIIESAYEKVSALSDLKEVSIEISGDDNPVITCDFNWQVEAVSNILKNCIDHSKNNGKIEVNFGENNAYSYIKIRDFGEGISPEDLPHIFERFYKGKNSSKDSSGIGLALTKSIVEKDNGTISVDSDENGSEFVIKYRKY